MLYQTFVIADLIFTGYNAATLNVFILRYLESLCWPELDIKKKKKLKSIDQSFFIFHGNYVFTPNLNHPHKLEA